MSLSLTSQLLRPPHLPPSTSSRNLRFRQKRQPILSFRQYLHPKSGFRQKRQPILPSPRGRGAGGEVRFRQKRQPPYLFLRASLCSPCPLWFNLVYSYFRPASVAAHPRPLVHHREHALHIA